MRLGVCAATIARVIEIAAGGAPPPNGRSSGRRPASAGVRLALRKHGHRRVVAVQALGGEDVCLDTAKQRFQRHTTCADLIGERR